ncbi:MAG: glycosyltransferase family 4 protein [Erythrobacter sp.]
MIKVAHLLDDFAMGGVTRALNLFEQPSLAAKGESRVMPVDPGARLAPSIDADLIVDHMALSWRRISFLLSLRLRNPNARIVHVEHSYTRNFEVDHVASQGRFRAMLKIASMLVDKFICVSDAQRDWLLTDVKLPSYKLTRIYPWSGRFELNAIGAGAPRKGRPLRLLAYGRFAEIKNFAELVLAMRNFATDEVELTLFGDGPDRERLAKLAEPLTHVKILPPTQEIAGHLAACDAVIVPSRREAFGLVATEARMAGRAVLAADSDGLPEQVGNAGLVASMKTEQDIAAAIRLALKVPMAQMGEMGRQEVASQHDRILDEWLYVFKVAARKAGKI